MILATMRNNIDAAKKTITLAAGRVPAKRSCGCVSALAGAITTHPEAVTAEQKKRLDLLIGKYLK
jgi:5'-methylthioadenosine phosphorylase